MKILIILVIVYQALATTNTVQYETQSSPNQLNDYNISSVETKGWVLNSQAKKFVKNILKQMPCGWPQLGVPSVAPYTNPDLEFHLINNKIESSLQFVRFKLDGLNDMIINNLRVSYTFDKLVKFHFQFKMLKITAAFLNMQILMDALEDMGIMLEYDGTNGPLEFTLHNLSIKGSFKYKMPIFAGTVKIYKFNANAKLDKVTSNIGHILVDNDLYNNLLNAQIDKLLPDIFNNNPKIISEQMEKQIVPLMNAFLDGKKLWDILAAAGAPGSKCKPTPAPWLRIHESDHV